MWTTFIILGLIELVMFAGYHCSHYYSNKPIPVRKPAPSREDSLRLLYDDMAMGYAERPLWILAKVDSDDDRQPHQYEEDGRSCLPLFTCAEAAAAFAVQHPNVEGRALESNSELLRHLDHADLVILDPGTNTEWTVPPGFVEALKAEIDGQSA